MLQSYICFVLENQVFLSQCSLKITEISCSTPPDNFDKRSSSTFCVGLFIKLLLLLLISRYFIFDIGVASLPTYPMFQKWHS